MAAPWADYQAYLNDMYVENGNYVNYAFTGGCDMTFGTASALYELFEDLKVNFAADPTGHRAFLVAKNARANTYVNWCKDNGLDESLCRHMILQQALETAIKVYDQLEA